MCLRNLLPYAELILLVALADLHGTKALTRPYRNRANQQVCHCSHHRTDSTLTLRRSVCGRVARNLNQSGVLGIVMYLIRPCTTMRYSSAMIRMGMDFLKVTSDVSEHRAIPIKTKLNVLIIMKVQVSARTSDEASSRQSSYWMKPLQ